MQALGAQGKDAQASALYLSQAAKLYAAVDGDLAALISVNDKVARQLDREIHADGSDRGLLLTLGLLALAFVLGVGVAFVVARGVSQMLSAARGIACGDVDQTVDVRSRDEIGDMAVAFEQMIEYLGEMSQAATRIAYGDLTRDVQPAFERDVLGTAFSA